MKTSNKLLLGAFVGILAVCMALLFMLRLYLNDAPAHRRTSTPESAMGLKEIQMKDLNGVDLRGNWEARIVREDKENIRVEGPEDLLAGLSVNRYGDSVELHMPKQKEGERKLRLTMTLPVIQSLRTRGVADVSISGFDLEDLAIDAKGVSSIRGEKGSIQNLHFRYR